MLGRGLGVWGGVGDERVLRCLDRSGVWIENRKDDKKGANCVLVRWRRQMVFYC